IDSFVKNGVNLIGGCCGTTPQFISQIAERVRGLKPSAFAADKKSAVTSARKTVFLGDDRPITIIGERINPTGKKKLQQSLLDKKMDEVKRLAEKQASDGAAILDINAGMPGIDEAEVVAKIIDGICADLDTPLCIDS